MTDHVTHMFMTLGSNVVGDWTLQGSYTGFIQRVLWEMNDDTTHSVRESCWHLGLPVSIMTVVCDMDVHQF